MLDSIIPAGAALGTILQKFNRNPDLTTFPKETNVVSDLGVTNKVQLLIRCMGEGKFEVTYMKDPLQAIKELGKLRDDGVLTDEEFQREKDKQLDMLG